jgi:hypothetical protein
MLFGGIIAPYCVNRTEHGQSVESINVKPAVHIVTIKVK